MEDDSFLIKKNSKNFKINPVNEHFSEDNENYIGLYPLVKKEQECSPNIDVNFIDPDNVDFNESVKIKKEIDVSEAIKEEKLDFHKTNIVENGNVIIGTSNGTFSNTYAFHKGIENENIEQYLFNAADDEDDDSDDDEGEEDSCYLDFYNKIQNEDEGSASNHSGKDRSNDYEVKGEVNNAVNEAEESLWQDLNSILYSEFEGVPFKCPQCEQVLSSRGNLKRHINTIHRGMKPFCCSECDARFSEKRTMEQHVACVHDNLRSFKCSDCDQSFNKKSTLKNHIESVHIKIRYKCEHCDEPKFFSKSGMRVHYETQHNPNPDTIFLEGRKYKPVRRPCPECSLMYSSNTTLKSHILSKHKGIKPFKCKDCPSKFVDMQKLKRHVKGVHLNLRPFGCPHCKSSFFQRSAVRKHIQSTHLKVKSYICPECQTPFAEKANMERHYATVHKGIKAFECKDCETKYTQRASLKYHLTVFHKISLKVAEAKGYLIDAGNTFFSKIT